MWRRTKLPIPVHLPDRHISAINHQKHQFYRHKKYPPPPLSVVRRFVQKKDLKLVLIFLLILLIILYIHTITFERQCNDESSTKIPIIPEVFNKVPLIPKTNTDYSKVPENPKIPELQPTVPENPETPELKPTVPEDPKISEQEDPNKWNLTQVVPAGTHAITVVSPSSCGQIFDHLAELHPGTDYTFVIVNEALSSDIVLPERFTLNNIDATTNVVSTAFLEVVDNKLVLHHNTQYPLGKLVNIELRLPNYSLSKKVYSDGTIIQKTLKIEFDDIVPVVQVNGNIFDESPAMDIYYWQMFGLSESHFSTLLDNQRIICFSPATISIQTVINVAIAIDKNTNILWFTSTYNLNEKKKEFFTKYMPKIANYYGLNFSIIAKPSKLMIYGKMEYSDLNSYLTFNGYAVDIDGKKTDDLHDFKFDFTKPSEKFKPLNKKVTVLENNLEISNFKQLLKFEANNNTS